jgi:hypothetical protein
MFGKFCASATDLYKKHMHHYDSIYIWTLVTYHAFDSLGYIISFATIRMLDNT